MHSKALNLRGRILIRIQLAPQELKVEPVVKEGVTTKATGPAAEASGMYSRTSSLYSRALTDIESAPKKPNLRPVYDGKMAVDEAGTQYYLTWSRFMVYASMADGGFKITGTGTASKVSW